MGEQLRALVRPPRVSVIGGAHAEPPALAAAEQVGTLLAAEGVTVVSGGLSGVMAAVCRGAVAAGGTTIGILPHYELEAANPYVTIPIATGIGFARNLAVVLNGDAVLAIDGSHGTLTEIGYGLLFFGTVVGLGTWQVPGVVPVGTPTEAVDALRPLWQARTRAPLRGLHHPPPALMLPPEEGWALQPDQPKR